MPTPKKQKQLKQRKINNMNPLNLFRNAPNPETFKGIQKNPWMLSRIFQGDKELAKKYFSFNEWLKICKNPSSLEENEIIEVEDLLKSSISSFDDAIKYHFYLPYDHRINWRNEFIDYAKSVKDLQFILNHIDKPNQREYEIYRKKIVSKMRQIAITKEEKKIAFSYKI